jgi:hypothetical protein
MTSARQGQPQPPALPGFAAANAQPEPVGNDGDVFDTQGDQFRAAERADEAEQR